MSWNWNEIEQNAGGNFKSYAPNGQYKVKLAKAEVKDNPNWKSPMVVFEWTEDDQYTYPKSTAHALSLGNANWRRFHHRNLLMEFGIAKDAAQKAIEVAEKDENRDVIVKAYQSMYDRIAQRHPEVEIVVRDQIKNGVVQRSDKGTAYSEVDFVNPQVATGQRNDNPNPLDGETVELDEEEMPF